MILSGLVVAEADGLHDDGWCWPVVRLRLIANGDFSELRVGVWMKPEAAEKDRTVFTLTSDRTPAKVQVVPFNSPVEIAMPITISDGETIDLRISTPHRASKGDLDARDLSFMLSSLVMI